MNEKPQSLQEYIIRGFNRDLLLESLVEVAHLNTILKLAVGGENLVFWKPLLLLPRPSQAFPFLCENPAPHLGAPFPGNTFLSTLGVLDDQQAANGPKTGSSTET